MLHDDPSNVSAHETMGYIAFREGNLSEARKWYDEAINLDSRSFLAYYYSAAIAVNSHQLDTEIEGHVETNLRTAIKLNPSFVPAYEELAVYYGMRHENLKEAQLLSLNALELDPGNLHYRLTTANVLLQMERPSDAIRVLQNATSLAKTPDEVGSVHNLLRTAPTVQGGTGTRKSGEPQRTGPTHLARNSALPSRISPRVDLDH